MAAVNSGYSEAILTSTKPRKRIKNCQNWKKVQEKIKRYSCDDKSPKIACNHGKDTRHRGTVCDAGALTIDTVRAFHTSFYDNTDKQTQDAFILTHMNIERPKMAKSKMQPTRGHVVKYYVSVFTCLFTTNIFFSILSNPGVMLTLSGYN